MAQKAGQSLIDRGRAAYETVHSAYKTLMDLHDGDYPSALRSLQNVHDSYTRASAPAKAPTMVPGEAIVNAGNK